MTRYRQLAKQDVLFVAGETSRVYQHTAGLVLLDPAERDDFNFETFREHAIERINLIPHFRWKLHEVPLKLDLPYWVEDQNFRIENHIKRMAIPSPGDRQALGNTVAYLYSRHLNRNRPLWELWYIEGLSDGRIAILQKLHHCIMDGQGANTLGEVMCDFEPDARPREVSPSIAYDRPGGVPTVLEQSVKILDRYVRLPSELSKEFAGFARPRLLQRVLGGGSKSSEMTLPPQTVFNADISSDRGFVFGSIPIEKIKYAKEMHNVTFNDVVLATIAGSVRRYLMEYGELPSDALRTSIAVSLRTDDDHVVSNKVTNTSVTLATNISDPKERLRAISAETLRAKNRARSGGKGMMDILQSMPPNVITAMVSVTPIDRATQMMGANIIVSNVRGSNKPMYLAGLRMQTMYPMSIISPGIGINFTCISYADNVDFGIAFAPENVEDPWSIVDGLSSSLEEYLDNSERPTEVIAKNSRTGRKKSGIENSKSGKKS